MTKENTLQVVADHDDSIMHIMIPFDEKLTKLVCNTARELIDLYENSPDDRGDARLSLQEITKVMEARPGS